MTLTESMYKAALGIARAAAPLAAGGESKLARGLRGRRSVEERLEAWASSGRDEGRPLVWFHAPSVGEGLQARAVIEALRAAEPGHQIAFTHFSPSAETLAARMPADVADYLPWDLPASMGRALDALRPALIVFTKTEVWPTLSALAARRGVATALAAATLPETSSRAGPLARRLLSPSYRRLDAVLAIAEEDARRLRSLGVAPEALRVTGDPGVDSAAERALAAPTDAPYLQPFRTPPAPTLVAGSTWPADEAALLDAAARLRQRVPELRLVLAPHEPDERHVPPLLEALRAGGWEARTLAEVERAGDLAGANAVVVERIGVLAHLYTIGTVAYVGGGFGNAGLHSVLEPAAAGLPVTFGPRHVNARAAADLLTLGGAAEVTDGAALSEAAGNWLVDDERRASASRAARGYIERHRGAARRTAEALAPLVRGS
jgi:3-deoxy-D-manno-octulosonic-acid transferase